MKNPKLRTRLHVRRRIHSRYPDYSLQQFIETAVETAGDAPEGVDPQEMLAAIAFSDELWALIAEAAGLKKRRDEVVEEIEKVRNGIVKSFEKKAKVVRK